MRKPSRTRPMLSPEETSRRRAIDEALLAATSSQSADARADAAAKVRALTPAPTWADELAGALERNDPRAEFVIARALLG